MFKDGQCEHHWSHDTHQADCQILAKRVPALHCQWLQQLLLFAFSSSTSLEIGGTNPNKKKSQGVRSGDLGARS